MILELLITLGYAMFIVISMMIAIALLYVSVWFLGFSLNRLLSVFIRCEDDN